MVKINLQNLRTLRKQVVSFLSQRRNIRELLQYLIHPFAQNILTFLPWQRSC